MKISSYWIGFFIIDYIKYLIVALASFALLWAFDVGVVLDDGKWPMMLCLLIAYGFAFIPFIYLVSFMFRNPTAG